MILKSLTPHEYREMINRVEEVAILYKDCVCLRECLKAVLDNNLEPKWERGLDCADVIGKLSE